MDEEAADEEEDEEEQVGQEEEEKEEGEQLSKAEPVKKEAAEPEGSRWRCGCLRASLWRMPRWSTRPPKRWRW